MPANSAKLGLAAAIEAKLGSSVFSAREKPEPETIPIGIREIDAECGGIPRGVITEITGPASSGRTTLLHSILAGMTAQGEACALVDASDAFDPASAAAAGVALQQLLWVRCGTHKNNALRVTDVLLQNGGWGMIVLDLGDIDSKDARRIPLHTGHRFRLAIENKPTVFLVIGQEPYAASCSAMVLETHAPAPSGKDACFAAPFSRPTGANPPAASRHFRAAMEHPGVPWTVRERLRAREIRI
ncbi:MAG: hypothetical protein HYX72_06145 [Acidobacteria bacterium]|nr:hypothetical protein [Acidobacteriota bacterium]